MLSPLSPSKGFLDVSPCFTLWTRGCWMSLGVYVYNLSNNQPAFGSFREHCMVDFAKQRKPFFAPGHVFAQLRHQHLLHILLQDSVDYRASRSANHQGFLISSLILLQPRRQKTCNSHICGGGGLGKIRRSTKNNTAPHRTSSLPPPNQPKDIQDIGHSCSPVTPTALQGTPRFSVSSTRCSSWSPVPL